VDITVDAAAITAVRTTRVRAIATTDACITAAVTR